MEKLIRLSDTELEVRKVVWKKESGISTSQIKAVLHKQRP